VARQLVPDVPPPERLEATLRGREAAARLLWNPHVAYRKLTSRLGRIKAPEAVEPLLKALTDPTTVAFTPSDRVSVTARPTWMPGTDAR